MIRSHELGNLLGKAGRGALFALAALSVSSCTNGLLHRSTKSASTLTESGTNGAIRPPIYVTQIVKNNISPQSDLDLVGDGTGAMGSFCPTIADCTCEFDYTNIDGAAESVQFQPDYVERDLVRCPYAILVQKGAPSANIRVNIKAQGTSSNTTSFVTQGNYGTVDSSNAANFAHVERYQCRDVARISHVLSGAVYDPFQSEDPEFTYPLDYFATNLGGTSTQFAASNNASWLCPTDIATNNLTGTNLYVYSKANGPNGSKQIFDPTNATVSKDRGTYYLSRGQTTVFTVPLNSYVAPFLPTDDAGATGRPPVGWGAAPIPNGPGKETCPTAATTPIPPGYHWVKLWLFRADLPARSYYKSTKFLANKLELICNPGLPLTTCGKAPTVALPSGTGGISAFGAVAPFATLADRLLDPNPVCVSVNPGAGSATNPDGTDLYQYETGADACAVAVSSQEDPFGFCAIHTPTILADTALTSVNYDAQGNGGQIQARYDFLIVASPTTVNTVDMRAGNATALEYTPYRFFTQNDCLTQQGQPPSAANLPAIDPDAAGCAPEKVITYGLKQHDMTTNGDPPASDPNRPGRFPMCALQPN